jgi:hypothetical protein
MGKSLHSPPPANLDVAADRHGKTVDVKPDNKKRLLELQGELEKSSGQRREAIQQEIERLRKGSRTSI